MLKDLYFWVYIVQLYCIYLFIFTESLFGFVLVILITIAVITDFNDEEGNK